MPSLDKLLKQLKLTDGRENPTEQHFQVARSLLEGKSIRESLLDGKFSEHVANHGKEAITLPILKALAQLGCNYEYPGQMFADDPKRIEHVVLGFLYTALVQRSSKGVNAARLLGSHKSVDMFAKPDNSQNIVVIQAPPEFKGIPEKFEAKPQRKALPPAEADMPDYE